LTESGKWDPSSKAQIAWPWTVYAEGRGRYLKSKSAAVREVLRLRARGVKNIDVGCMQVNLKYHPDAFASLDKAFEPMSNADYAASFLKSLYRQHRSWTRAVEHYHSSTPKYRLPYRKKVMRAWQNERRRSYAARAQAARDSYQAKRQAWLDRRRNRSYRRFADARIKPRTT
jgi:hypothetical protein